MRLQDLVYHLQIVDPLQIYPETGLRMECIRRLAIVLDMPPEVLLGVATVNHWGAWMIDEQSWKVHLQPVAQGLVEDLTSAYLQPYLMQEEEQDWGKYVIGYDASKVINHPDRTKDALLLHAEGIVGDAAVLDAAGFDEEDKPTQEELARIIGVKVRDASLAWYGIPSVKAGGIEPEAGVIDQGGNPQEGTPTTPTGAEAEKGPPPGGPNEPGTEDTVGSGMLAFQIEGAAQLALLRSREAAGSRLRTITRRSPELEAAIDGCKNRDVAAILGRANVRTLLGGPREAELVAAAHDLILDALRVFGVDEVDVAEVVADTIERHAVRTLYDERLSPLPATFGSYVEGLLASARNGHREAD
jgi:hypothetical protein